MFGVYGTWDSHHPPPHLHFCVKSQVWNVGGLLLSAFHHQRTSRCTTDVAPMFSSIVCLMFFLIFYLKGLTTKNTQKCILTWQHVLSFINKKNVASGMESKKVRRCDDRSEGLGDNWPAHTSADRWHYHPFPCAFHVTWQENSSLSSFSRTPFQNAIQLVYFLFLFTWSGRH